MFWGTICRFYEELHPLRRVHSLGGQRYPTKKHPDVTPTPRGLLTKSREGSLTVHRYAIGIHIEIVLLILRTSLNEESIESSAKHETGTVQSRFYPWNSEVENVAYLSARKSPTYASQY